MMVKDILNAVLNFIFIKVASFFFYVFDKYFLHRLSFARGRASLMAVKNRGPNSLIHGYCKIIAPDRLEIGDYVRIGTGCYLNCLGGVSIGNNAQISRDVVIYSSLHNYEGEAVPYDDKYQFRKVIIGESVWIGMGVSILPGVTIGDGAIVGMGTVITKDVPPNAIVVGSQQRIVKYRSSDSFYSLNGQKKWFGKMFPGN